MKPVQLIDSARQLTFDTKVDQETWKVGQYLLALNDARVLLFARHPESRVTASGGLTTYADIESAQIDTAMTEDTVYRTFFTEYMAYRFYVADSRDTANAERAGRHKKAFEEALATSVKGG